MLLTNLHVCVDMLDSMKNYAIEKKVLAGDERNLLSVAFKNIVGERRNSYKVLLSRVDSATGEEKVLAEEYLEKIRKELDDICNAAILFLDENLILNTPETEVEAKVFYLKMYASGEVSSMCNNNYIIS